MPLYPTRPPVALRRPRQCDLVAVSNAIRGFHVSASRHAESGGPPSDSRPTTLRGRSAAASDQISRLAPRAPKILTPRRIPSAVPQGQNRDQNQNRGPRIIRQPVGPGNSALTENRLMARFRPRGPGAPGRPLGPQHKRAGRGRNRRKDDQSNGQDDEEKPLFEDYLSDIFVKHLVDLKHEQTKTKIYLPQDPQTEKLFGNGTATAQDVPQLVEEHLRFLAARKRMGYESYLALARRIAHGHFVKFKDAEDRDNTMAVVQKEQERKAAMLSAKKGKEIKPLAWEFEPLSGAAKKKAVDLLVKGHYEMAKGESWDDGVKRILQGNGTYASSDTNKFMARLNAVTAALGGPGRIQLGAGVS